jgi:predicted oxidoreductase
MTVPRRRLASSGPEVSRLALGLWRLGDWRLGSDGILALIEACLGLGITTFDHADIYGDHTCEGLFGEALGRRPELRSRMELVTKCGIKLVSERRPGRRLKHYDTGRAHILASVESSLRELRTDRIDLLLLHRPDPLLDPDEVAGAFSELHEAGKVLHFGLSNFTAAQFEMLAARVSVPLVTHQIEISPLSLDAWSDGTLDQCQRLRMAPMAWSPLAGGRLFTGEDERAQRVRRVLGELATELDAGPDQVALAWLLAHPAGIVPILGSGNLDRIRGAAAACGLRVDRERWFRLWTASTGQDVP